MADVSKIKLPDNNEYNIKDARIPSVSSSDNGKVMQVVGGAWSAASVVIPTYYTGTSDPSSSLGSDGDIYLKISS